MNKFWLSASYWVLCGAFCVGVGKAFADFNNLCEEKEGTFVLEYTGKINDEAIDNFIKEKKALDERVEKREQEEQRRKEQEEKKKGIVKVSSILSSISSPQHNQSFVSSSWTCSSCYISNTGSSTHCMGCGSKR